jgi:hypothetical protein
LVLDGHSSHTTISEALRGELISNRILMVFLPSHCTGVLQVCDTHLFSPVKISFRKEARKVERFSSGAVSRASWIPTFFDVCLQRAPQLHMCAAVRLC